jgi:hypothetical protein
VPAGDSWGIESAGGLCYLLAQQLDVVWFPIEELPTRSLPSSGSKEERAPRFESGVPWRFLTDELEVLMNGIIGVDPHKATHTAVAIGCDEVELATVRVRATKQQTDRLVDWAKPVKKRVARGWQRPQTLQRITRWISLRSELGFRR